MKAANPKVSEVEARARVLEEMERRRRLKVPRVSDPDFVAGPLSFREFVDRVNPRYRWYRHCEMLAGVLQRVADGQIKRLLVFEPPRHGKCLKVGTPVLMADGSWKAIEDVCRLDMVMSVDSGYNLTERIVNNTQFNGVKPVLRLTLYSGRQLTCTENHPLLTVEGWRNAGNLGEGDSIAVLAKSPMPDGEPLPFGFASLMGYLTGDGSFGRGSPIVTSSEPEVVSHLGRIAESHDWKLYRDGRYGYHIRKRSNLDSRGGKSATERLRPFMKPSLSKDKRVPPCIWRANREDLVDFLAAYFNCDGSVNSCREGVAEFYSVSEGLLRDTQHLLTRLGIFSLLRQKNGRYKGEIHRSWRLILSGVDLVRFADQVPVIGKRGVKLRDVADKIRGRRSFPQYDAIPPGWKNLTRKGIGWHRAHSGIRADKKYSRGTARHVVLAVALAEDNDVLHKVCDPDIAWERIEKIEILGDHPTYDIEVGVDHNFIADGIVVHNSETVSRMFSAYWLYRNPDKWVGLCSYGADLAYTMSRAARDNFVRAGGAIRSDAAAVKHWETTNCGGMWATGVGGPATGKGFSLGIIDDPLKNAEEAASATIRAKQLDWYRSTFYTREDPNKDGKPDGAIIVIQTRWNEADLSGELLAEEAGDGDHEHWHIVNFAAIAEAEFREFPATCTVEPDWRRPGEALCPERRPVEKLERIRDRIGGYYFAALYQQRPRPDEGTLFPSAWPIVECVPINSDYVRYWDKAGSDDKGDYSAGVLMAQAPDGRYFIADVVRGRWSAATREAVILQTAKFDGRGISIRVEQEPGSGGKESAENTIRMLAGWDVKAEPVTGDKIARARPFAAQAEVSNVSLVRGDWNRVFVDELRSFPHGAHDDQVDAASGAFNKLALMPRSLGITGAVRVPVEKRMPPGPRPLDTRVSATYDQWNDKDRGFSGSDDPKLDEIAEVHDRHFSNTPKRRFYGR